MSRRVLERLRTRCGTRAEGWVSPSKYSAAGHLRSIDRLFQEARQQAGLPKELVLYCARHDYGTRVLMRTGNLAAVMNLYCPHSFVGELHESPYVSKLNVYADDIESESIGMEYWAYCDSDY
jgi:hypothetical protein